jgi:putative phosphoesterase
VKSGAGMKQVIGLISDTHGLYRPQVTAAFVGVDLIVHAGDVGGDEVLDRLAELAPVEAVFGNVDDPYNPRLARRRTIPIGALTLHVSHGHELARVRAEVVLARYPGDVVLFGHTHKAVVHRAAAGRLAVNPGAAGPRRFDIRPSVARLTVVDGAAAVDIILL